MTDRKAIEWYARWSRTRVLATAFVFALLPAIVPVLRGRLKGELVQPDFPYYVWGPFLLLVLPLLHTICRYLVDLERRPSAPHASNGPE